MTAFDQYLRTRSKGHLIGVGGVSMSPLAEVLAGAGMPLPDPIWPTAIRPHIWKNWV